MKKGNLDLSDIIIHAAELEERCEYAPAVSVFLTPSEQAELWRYVRFPHRLFFWGGFSGAERRCAVFLPEWVADAAPYDSNTGWDSPERESYLRTLIFGTDAPFEELSSEIRLIRIRGSGHRVLAHKDILGSLMGLGITRQSAGDICMISESEAAAAVNGKLFEYIKDEFKKAGTDGVRIDAVADPASFVYERQFQEICVTVASLRLDGVVSAVTGLSRTKATEHITAGLVQLSGITETEGSVDVSVGETVTVRGYGKFLISAEDGVTRKSRIRLNVKKYM